jgi:hypothetical protein
MKEYDIFFKKEIFFRRGSNYRLSLIVLWEEVGEEVFLVSNSCLL